MRPDYLGDAATFRKNFTNVITTGQKAAPKSREHRMMQKQLSVLTDLTQVGWGQHYTIESLVGAAVHHLESLVILWLPDCNSCL